MTEPHNIFGDLLGDITKLLPPEVGQAIQDVVGTILDPTDTSINPGDPQPAGPPPIPVAPESDELNAAVKAIDVALAALSTLLKLSFLIPEPYEGYLHKIVEALTTVRGWLD